VGRGTKNKKIDTGVLAQIARFSVTENLSVNDNHSRYDYDSHSHLEKLDAAPQHGTATWHDSCYCKNRAKTFGMILAIAKTMPIQKVIYICKNALDAPPALVV